MSHFFDKLTLIVVSQIPKCVRFPGRQLLLHSVNTLETVFLWGFLTRLDTSIEIHFLWIVLENDLFIQIKLYYFFWKCFFQTTPTCYGDSDLPLPREACDLVENYWLNPVIPFAEPLCILILQVLTLARIELILVMLNHLISLYPLCSL